MKNDVAIGLLSNLVTINKTTQITGQVQPSDFANFDDRYYKKGDSDNRYIRIRSTGFNVASTDKWAKIATVVMPQSASTAAIEVFGGSGFDSEAPNQAGKFEIVLRTANNNPKGLNVVAWKNAPNSLISDIGYVNTSGDTYDIYCKVGNFQNWTTSRVQSSSNASVQLFETPPALDAAPEGLVKGTVAQYYTSLQKPTPADIGAYTKQEVDAKLQSVGQSTADYKNVYPIGMVVFFNSNVNPNSTFTGTKWAYLTGAAGRTIRIANATGDNVTKTGGSDSVTLTLDHLPQHTHTFSGSSSAFDYGTKGTNAVGDHAHSVNLNTNAAGNHRHRDGRRFDGNVFKDTYQYGATSSGVNNWSVQGAVGRIPSDLANTSTDGNHSHNVSGNTTGAGNHSHSVAIGAHTHTFSGTTGANGKGQAFSVTNPHYFLMAWVRTA